MKHLVVTYLGFFFFLFTSHLAFSQELPAPEACAMKIHSAIAMEIISSNIANAETTRIPEGGPYKRLMLSCVTQNSCEVISEDSFKLIYLPDHPDANDEGYVQFPTIDVGSELNDLNEASRTFDYASKFCQTSNPGRYKAQD
jgi:flagellar basal body rod protein FlgC